MAIVMTTSSGCFCSKAAKPVTGAPVRCEESCCRRCRAIASSFEEALLASKAMSYCDDVHSERNQFIRNLIPGRASVPLFHESSLVYNCLLSLHFTFKFHIVTSLDQDHAVGSLPHNNHWLSTGWSNCCIRFLPPHDRQDIKCWLGMRLKSTMQKEVFRLQFIEFLRANLSLASLTLSSYR